MSNAESRDGSGRGPKEPSLTTEEMVEVGARIALEFDPRLADVWLEIFASDLDPELFSQVGWYLRMAYLCGFKDGAADPNPAEMFARIGMEAPDAIRGVRDDDQQGSKDRTEGGSR